MIRNLNQLKRAGSAGRFVIRTMGEGYSLDTGVTIAAALARAQLDLFEKNSGPSSGFVAQDDGLFPGFSQTWRAD